MIVITSMAVQTLQEEILLVHLMEDGFKLFGRETSLTCSKWE
jgi:hypothetical protein